MTKYHIAQLNMSKGRDTMDSKTMRGFVDRLDEINSLADNSTGFVWRLQEDDDTPASTEFNDPLLIVNLSVWADLESLKIFVYKTSHVELIRDRSAWFHGMAEAHQVLWNVPAGHLPGVAEASAKLDYLRAHGPGENAFTFAKPFAPKGTE